MSENGSIELDGHRNLAAGQSIAFKIPLKVLKNADGTYNASTFNYGVLSFGDSLYSEDIYGQARIAANAFNMKDKYGINGTNKYLVTYRTEDSNSKSTYWQASDIQNLMPAISPNDIVVNDFNPGQNPDSTNNNFPYLYAGGNFYVNIDNLKDAKGNNWIQTLADNGYGVPVWPNNNDFFTYYAWKYSGEPSENSGTNDGSQWMNKNGIGGINLQVIKVIDVNGINDQDQLTLKEGAKWDPKANVKIFNPDSMYQTALSSETKPDITIPNTRKNADGTLNTSTPGSFDITYTYNYKYLNGTSRTFKKTIHVTVSNGSTPNTNNGGTSANTGTATGSNTTNTNNANESSSSTSSTNDNGTTTTTQEPVIPSGTAKKGTVVYATKAIYMYKKANFKKSQRIAKYTKAKRVNRPMFVVTGYAYSKGGALRYKVRDVNHGTKTANKKGYITANKKFVVRVYYSSMPKNKKITVINKKGVNAYKKANLTKKVKNYKKGTRLTVKKLVKHNLTTRYQLSNGKYVTANKKLVIAGSY